MANKSTGITSTPETTGTPSPRKINIHWPSRCMIQNWLCKVFKALGRIGAGAILLFALAHLVPELREEMPNFYRFIDFIIDAIEWVYTQFWAIIT